MTIKQIKLLINKNLLSFRSKKAYLWVPLLNVILALAFVIFSKGTGHHSESPAVMFPDSNIPPVNPSKVCGDLSGQFSEIYITQSSLADQILFNLETLPKIEITRVIVLPPGATIDMFGSNYQAVILINNEKVTPALNQNGIAEKSINYAADYIIRTGSDDANSQFTDSISNGYEATTIPYNAELTPLYTLIEFSLAQLNGFYPETSMCEMSPHFELTIWPFPSQHVISIDSTSSFYHFGIFTFMAPFFWSIIVFTQQEKSQQTYTSLVAMGVSRFTIHISHILTFLFISIPIILILTLNMAIIVGGNYLVFFALITPLMTLTVANIIALAMAITACFHSTIIALITSTLQYVITLLIAFYLPLGLSREFGHVLKFIIFPAATKDALDQIQWVGDRVGISYETFMDFFGHIPNHPLNPPVLTLILLVQFIVLTLFGLYLDSILRQSDYIIPFTWYHPVTVIIQYVQTFCRHYPRVLREFTPSELGDRVSSLIKTIVHGHSIINNNNNNNTNTNNNNNNNQDLLDFDSFGSTQTAKLQPRRRGSFGGENILTPNRHASSRQQQQPPEDNGFKPRDDDLLSIHSLYSNHSATTTNPFDAVLVEEDKKNKYYSQFGPREDSLLPCDEYLFQGLPPIPSTLMQQLSPNHGAMYDNDDNNNNTHSPHRNNNNRGKTTNLTNSAGLLFDSDPNVDFNAPAGPQLPPEYSNKEILEYCQKSVLQYPSSLELRNPSITLKKVTKSFMRKSAPYGEHNALDELNLRFYRGQIHAVLGRNGTGKSLVLAILAQMTRPTHGSVFIHYPNQSHSGLDAGEFTGEIVPQYRSPLETMLNDPFTQFDLAKKARQKKGQGKSLFETNPNLDEDGEYTPSYGICFQHDTVYGGLTVYENLEFFSKIKESVSGFELTEEQRDVEIAQLLRMIQLEDKANDFVDKLSGGQRRKVSVAIALLHNPQIVLMDNLTSGADVHSQRTIWSLLEKQKVNRTVIFATQSLQESLIADRITILKNGAVACSGNATFLKEQFEVGNYLLSIDKEATIANSTYNSIKWTMSSNQPNNDSNTTTPMNNGVLDAGYADFNAPLPGYEEATGTTTTTTTTSSTTTTTNTTQLSYSYLNSNLTNGFGSIADFASFSGDSGPMSYGFGAPLHGSSIGPTLSRTFSPTTYTPSQRDQLASVSPFGSVPHPSTTTTTTTLPLLSSIHTNDTNGFQLSSALYDSIPFFAQNRAGFSSVPGKDENQALPTLAIDHHQIIMGLPTELLGFDIKKMLVLHSDSAMGISYTIQPGQEQYIPILIDYLDVHKERLWVKSVSITTTTLDDVFDRIHQDDSSDRLNRGVTDQHKNDDDFGEYLPAKGIETTHSAHSSFSSSSSQNAKKTRNAIVPSPSEASFFSLFSASGSGEDSKKKSQAHSPNFIESLFFQYTTSEPKRERPGERRLDSFSGQRQDNSTLLQPSNLSMDDELRSIYTEEALKRWYDHDLPRITNKRSRFFLTFRAVLFKRVTVLLHYRRLIIPLLLFVFVVTFIQSLSQYNARGIAVVAFDKLSPKHPAIILNEDGQHWSDVATPYGSFSSNQTDFFASEPHLSTYYAMPQHSAGIPTGPSTPNLVKPPHIPPDGSYRRSLRGFISTAFTSEITAYERQVLPHILSTIDTSPFQQYSNLFSAHPLGDRQHPTYWTLALQQCGIVYDGKVLTPFGEDLSGSSSNLTLTHGLHSFRATSFYNSTSPYALAYIISQYFRTLSALHGQVQDVFRVNETVVNYQPTTPNQVFSDPLEEFSFFNQFTNPNRYLETSEPQPFLVPIAPIHRLHQGSASISYKRGNDAVTFEVLGILTVGIVGSWILFSLSTEHSNGSFRMCSMASGGYTFSKPFYAANYLFDIFLMFFACTISITVPTIFRFITHSRLGYLIILPSFGRFFLILVRIAFILFSISVNFVSIIYGIASILPHYRYLSQLALALHCIFGVFLYAAILPQRQIDASSYFYDALSFTLAPPILFSYYQNARAFELFLTSSAQAPHFGPVNVFPPIIFPLVSFLPAIIAIYIMTQTSFSLERFYALARAFVSKTGVLDTRPDLNLVTSRGVHKSRNEAVAQMKTDILSHRIATGPEGGDQYSLVTYGIRKVYPKSLRSKSQFTRNCGCAWLYYRLVPCYFRRMKDHDWDVYVKESATKARHLKKKFRDEVIKQQQDDFFQKRIVERRRKKKKENDMMMLKPGIKKPSQRTNDHSMLSSLDDSHDIDIFPPIGGQSTTLQTSTSTNSLVKQSSFLVSSASFGSEINPFEVDILQSTLESQLGDEEDEGDLDAQDFAESLKPTVALQSTFLSVRKNSVTALLGTNGSGKSTLMSILTGETHPTPALEPCQSQTIFHDKTNIFELPLSIQLNSTKDHHQSRIEELLMQQQYGNFDSPQIAYCPQSDRLNMELTPRQTLVYYCALYGIDPAIYSNLIPNLLTAMLLADFADTPCAELSPGHLRLVSIAIAIFPRADLTLLDEFSTNLDPMARRVIHKLLQKMSRTNTIILTSHIMEEVEQLADSVAILSQGELIAYGTKGLLKQQQDQKDKSESKMGTNPSESATLSSSSSTSFGSGGSNPSSDALGDIDLDSDLDSDSDNDFDPFGHKKGSQANQEGPAGMCYTVNVRVRSVHRLSWTKMFLLSVLANIPQPQFEDRLPPLYNEIDDDDDNNNNNSNTNQALRNIKNSQDRQHQQHQNNNLIHMTQEERESAARAAMNRTNYQLWTRFVKKCRSVGVYAVPQQYSNRFTITVNTRLCSISQLFVTMAQCQAQCDDILKYLCSQPTIDQLFTNVVDQAGNIIGVDSNTGSSGPTLHTTRNVVM